MQVWQLCQATVYVSLLTNQAEVPCQAQSSVCLTLMRYVKSKVLPELVRKMKAELRKALQLKGRNP